MSAPEYFAFFGVERRLNLDQADLQQRFYRLSRELHPDRFMRGTAAEREQALEKSAILNDAYRVLRDPLLRAEYVVSGAGLETGDEKRVPSELLEKVFEVNEVLESGDRASIESARDHLIDARDRSRADMERLFARHDAGDESALPELRSVLNRRRYIDKLIRQVEGALAHV
ncbi:MAG TPA: Fe-S protein assembly co-chaperone HscB [Bryobacteraceae bacterium]|nr:Fe-S protein assembly co-chaperone HscB [Bryobacteraceae bacterium]